MHPEIKANFLMSPPLVVAYGLAGRIDIDFATEPIGPNDAGEAVYLKDIWPTRQEIAEMIGAAVDRQTFREMYEAIGNQAPNGKNSLARRVYFTRGMSGVPTSSIHPSLKVLPANQHRSLTSQMPVFSASSEIPLQPTISPLQAQLPQRVPQARTYKNTALSHEISIPTAPDAATTA